MTSIRQIAVGDAGAFLELRRKLDQETAFMLFEPGERTTTVEEQEKRIEKLLSSGNQTVLVAEDEGRLVGFIAASGGSVRRNRHCVHIVIGILRSHAGQGLGKRLFAEAESWARASGLHRLELTVMTHNARGIGLYRKMGFETEGTKRHSMKVDGCYVDELFMSKLL